MVELLASELALARAWTSGEPGMGLYTGCQVNVVIRPIWTNENYLNWLSGHSQDQEGTILHCVGERTANLLRVDL